jgi:hypothetical protein
MEYGPVLIFYLTEVYKQYSTDYEKLMEEHTHQDKN